MLKALVLRRMYRHKGAVGLVIFLKKYKSRDPGIIELFDKRGGLKGLTINDHSDGLEHLFFRAQKKAPR